MDKENKWPVENYASWKNKSWLETALVKGNCSLIIRGTQMFIVNKDTAVESICLIGGNGIVSATYINDTIGVSIKDKGIHKFRFRLGEGLGKSSIENCLDAVGSLRRFISVTEHPSNTAIKAAIQQKTKPLTQITKELLELDPNLFKNCELAIPELCIEETLQQCILDPGFPALVASVEKLLMERGEEETERKHVLRRFNRRSFDYDSQKPPTL